MGSSAMQNAAGRNVVAAMTISRKSTQVAIARDFTRLRADSRPPTE